MRTRFPVPRLAPPPVRPVLALLTPLIALSCSADRRPPGVLVGKWTTDAPQFEDCAMRFDPDGGLVLRLSGGDEQLCLLVSAELVEGSTPPGWLVEYEDPEGNEQHLEMTLVGPDTAILPGRRDVEWRRSRP